MRSNSNLDCIHAFIFVWPARDLQICCTAYIMAYTGVLILEGKFTSSITFSRAFCWLVVASNNSVHYIPFFFVLFPFFPTLALSSVNQRLLLHHTPKPINNHTQSKIKQCSAPPCFNHHRKRIGFV